MSKAEINENIKNRFALLNSIHNQIESLCKNDKESIQSTNESHNELNDYHMLIKFLKNNNILFNNKTNFINFIQQLELFLKDNENIIFPFLDSCPKLVKAYMESDLDEEKLGEYKYMKIFSLLTRHSFINKENLFPIYSFLSELLSDITTIKENDIRLKKMTKIMDLWLIFYSFNNIDINEKEKINEYQESSICFLGGSLTALFKEEISPEKKIIEINIDFLKNQYINLINGEYSFLKINNIILITYKEIEKYLKEKVYAITIIIEYKKITINFNYTEHSDDKHKMSKSKDKIKSFSKTEKFSRIKNIVFLDNYYGEVKLIKVTLKNVINKRQSEVIFENIYKPYLETSTGYLKKDNEANILLKDLDSTLMNMKKPTKYSMLLKITDKKFTKVNYINYGDSEFSIVDYLGNIVQLLPFSYIIQKLLINDNIKIIFGENKNKICFIILEKVLQGFFNCLLYNKYNKKIIKKYFLFVYSLFLEIVKTYNTHNQKDILENKDQKEYNIKEILTNIFIFSNMNKFDHGDFLINFYIKLINSFGDNSYESTIKELVGNVFVSEKKDYPYSDTEDFIKLYYVLPEKTYSQLYKKLMKPLFIYNRMWSKKDYFFKTNNNGPKTKPIKYKQMNYYTKNFQQPLLYPILELDKYYPDFSKFKIEKLYKDSNEKIFNYNFSLNEDGTYINNIITKYVEKYLKKQSSLEKCCLVKKTHHIKGSMSVIEMDYNNVDCFELLFFSSMTQDTDPICNNTSNSSGNDNQKNTCYGSTFPCPKKDYGKIYNIKSRDILFILIREYYHRVSAIEIFTVYNKSYFFNFNELFVNDKSKHLNQTLKKISNYFKKIKISIPKKDKKVLLGYYNPDFQQYLYPLFSEDINVWKKKNKCYSNYDKLIIINLLSNRSFKDIYQYPVFPMFYNHIGIKERDMNSHIGFLELNEESKKRKQQIIESYQTNLDDKKFLQEQEEICLFNTYYSNPIYTCNYLLRIFPYSFISIEFQGGGFDDPNRLFYSIPKAMKNTLSQKSDYREMIPELFYMPELFENGNDLELNKISDGQNIDNVKFSNILNSSDGNNTENCESFQKYRFLSDMREVLENEKKINQWIDLIFGVEQKETESHQVYFEKQSQINYENNSDLYNDPLSLQSVDFGLIPFQLFYEKFPNSFNYMQYFYQLKSENIIRFENEHKSDHDPRQCFIYRGRNFLSPKYLEIIKDINSSNYNVSQDEEKAQNLNNDFEKIKYDFIGDVFGFVTIISRRNPNSKSNKDKNNNANNSMRKTVNKASKILKDNLIDDKVQKKYKSVSANLFIKNPNEESDISNQIKLCDHYKQIKYIDYNPRLNLFLTYALDGFINIYTFPLIKLIRTIKIDDYYENDNYLKKVVLISNPFPMIFCHNDNKMFVFSINGELIRSKNIEHGTEFIPCIDKDLGLIRDHVEMRRRIHQNNTALSSDLYFPMI